MAGRVRSGRRGDPHPLGQHFLRSTRLAAAIVADAGVAPCDRVVEVGAGGGILTAELARAGARLTAVELDPVWAARLRRRFGGRVEVQEGDALARPWPQEPFSVVGSLPFARGTDILRSLLEHPRIPLVRAHVVLQWEVAWKRAAPWPSTLAGVLWSAWYDMRVLRRIARTAFAPPPAVDAGLLRVVRRTDPLVPERDALAFQRFVRSGFEDAPAGLVPPRTWKRLAADLGFDPHARARDLDARQWAALFASVRAAR